MAHRPFFNHKGFVQRRCVNYSGAAFFMLQLIYQFPSLIAIHLNR